VTEHLHLPLLLVSILAGAIAAVSGFGIGSVITPLLLLRFSAPEAVSLVALPHAWATALRLYQLRRSIHGPTFRQFGLASAAGGLAGALLQGSLGGLGLTLVLALLLLTAGVGEVRQRPVPLPDSPGWKLAGGALSGFFGGLVGNQGGIRAAALLQYGLTPREIVATATATALLVDAARVPVYATRGASFIASQIPLVLWISLGVTVGTGLGVPLLGRLKPTTYRRLVGALLILLAVFLVGLAVR
jgi:uncharacterized membrane protein YfcA